jgi:lipopolysaccharide export system protein LptC
MFKNLIKSIILAIAGMMLLSCENSLSKINEITIIEDTLAAITTYDIVFSRSDSGFVRVVLSSPLMKRYVGQDEYNEFPNGFEIVFFDKNGGETSTITANYGVDYQKRKYMNARNNVVIRNYETGEELYTENLVWDKKSKLIKSNTFVKVIMPDKTIFGDSMCANEEFTEHQIFNIKGEFDVVEDSVPNN